MKLIYNVKDKPKFGQLIVFAIQQLLAIMAATLVVPVIIGHGMSPAAALLGAGTGTLVYVMFTQAKSPVFLGSSFAFLGSMASAFAGGVSVALGYVGLIIGASFAGLVYVIIALIVKSAGVKWVSKLMPAVVIGPTVAIIGLSLAGNAVSDIVNADIKTFDPTPTSAVVYYDSTDENGNPSIMKQEIVLADGTELSGTYTDDNGNVQKFEAAAATGQSARTLASRNIALVCGLVTLAVTMLSATFGKKAARLIPFVIGILSGYAVATVFTIIGFAAGVDSLKIIDFSVFSNLLSDGKVTLNTFFTLPEFTFMRAFGAFGELSGSYIGSIAVAYVPVAFVVFAEHIADHKNISSIIETDLLEDPGLHRTLLGDGVGSMVGAFFGGCPNTTYGESIGCVAITGNASVVTIIAAAIGAIIIAFVNPFVAFVDSIPPCVMGGVCMALYGFIAVSGLKMVQVVDLDDNKNLFVVSVILIAGIGGLTVSFGDIKITSIACALILGILTNLMLHRGESK